MNWVIRKPPTRLGDLAAMKPSPALDKPVVVLIGNYPLDRQESMLRFLDLIQSQLKTRGFLTESISPQGYLGRLARKGTLAKWLGYIDKYILFPPVLARRLSRIKREYPDRKIVVHICDHANAVYARLARRWFPVLVTCHDLLARARRARGRHLLPGEWIWQISPGCDFPRHRRPRLLSPASPRPLTRTCFVFQDPP